MSAALQAELNGRTAPAPAAPVTPVANGAGVGAVGLPLAKPPVRKLAKDLGIDLATIVPSGPDGIITREDVHAAAAPAAALPGRSGRGADPGRSGGDRRRQRRRP